MLNSRWFKVQFRWVLIAFKGRLLSHGIQSQLKRRILNTLIGIVTRFELICYLVVMVGFVWSWVAFSENFHVIVLLNNNTMFTISIVIGFDESDIMRLEWKSSLHSREESGGWLGLMHAINVSLAKLKCVPMYSRYCDADFSLICLLCSINDMYTLIEPVLQFAILFSKIAKLKALVNSYTQINQQVWASKVGKFKDNKECETPIF